MRTKTQMEDKNSQNHFRLILSLFILLVFQSDNDVCRKTIIDEMAHHFSACVSKCICERVFHNKGRIKRGVICERVCHRCYAFTADQISIQVLQKCDSHWPLHFEEMQKMMSHTMNCKKKKKK